VTRERNTDRLEFFSDAVIAIAATLLAVELHPPRPDELGQATLLQAIGHEWASYLAFAISFLFIGIAWAAHHDMFNYIKRTNHTLLVLNLFFLMGIALQPFSTALLSEYWRQPEERTATLIYHGILLTTSLCFNAVWLYAVNQHRLVEDGVDSHLLRTIIREHSFAPISHATAFVVALWNTTLSFIPLLVLYIFFALPRIGDRIAKKPR
jgi:uncharacterized membrane protein